MGNKTKLKIKSIYINHSKIDTFYKWIISSMINKITTWSYNIVKKVIYWRIWTINNLNLVCQLNKLKIYQNKSQKDYLIYINKTLFIVILNPVIFLSIKKIKSKYVILDFLRKWKINKKLKDLKEHLITLLLNVCFIMIKKLMFGL